VVARPVSHVTGTLRERFRALGMFRHLQALPGWTEDFTLRWAAIPCAEARISFRASASCLATAQHFLVQQLLVVCHPRTGSTVQVFAFVALSELMFGHTRTAHNRTFRIHRAHAQRP